MKYQGLVLKARLKQFDEAVEVEDSLHLVNAHLTILSPPRELILNIVNQDCTDVDLLATPHPHLLEAMNCALNLA